MLLLLLLLLQRQQNAALRNLRTPLPLLLSFLRAQQARSQETTYYAPRPMNRHRPRASIVPHPLHPFHVAGVSGFPPAGPACPGRARQVGVSAFGRRGVVDRRRAAPALVDPVCGWEADRPRSATRLRRDGRGHPGLSMAGGRGGASSSAVFPCAAERMRGRTSGWLRLLEVSRREGRP